MCLLHVRDLGTRAGESKSAVAARVLAFFDVAHLVLRHIVLIRVRVIAVQTLFFLMRAGKAHARFHTGVAPLLMTGVNIVCHALPTVGAYTRLAEFFPDHKRVHT